METIEPRHDWRGRLQEGVVIPALPLALHEDGSWSKRHQRALIRYYVEAGAGGLAVAVHSTQFEIREPSYGLFEPVLRLAAETLDAVAEKDFVRIAGVCGETRQAVEEADLAKSLGYHAALVSLAAFANRSEADAIAHLKSIGETLPIVGFYLQPAVGGRVLSYRFWKSFCELEHAIAIKIAPFNRYQTLDVVRAVMESDREDITLYTGNDDNIILDLLTPFQWNGKTRFISGGLLGQWGVWTQRAVQLLDGIKQARQSTLSAEWLIRNTELTDVNAAIFDAANQFRGCIPGILEVLRRQGLVPSSRCLDPGSTLSDGQREEIDRVIRSYPAFLDDDFVIANRDRWLEGED
jgi:dihydrodipicolinate synthase/N-acetylneuraminate lyase